ncbi:hypothetical protein [Maridesulfovibrio ferrireducens]|uniref:hypothetical protein n=1 Tax=Maridesulfovibrio ferrireducens TaxID=246191 RepID=UPI001A2F4AB4|nr:hypothetical protein [Maridesulfovibrio ferrireducens]MBI9112421.1 hypothetical protein [Maridesulfovibrio ferrireducens]
MSKSKIHPIPFNIEMVRAIMDGRKTQTRRLVMPQPEWGDSNGLSCAGWAWRSKNEELSSWPDINRFSNALKKCAPYQVGDILWVREPAKVVQVNDYAPDGMSLVIRYLADNEIAQVEVPARMSEMWEIKYRDKWPVPAWVEKFQGIPNGIFKEACRTWRKVTGVRVERLQDISGLDVLAEGINSLVHPNANYFEASQHDAFERIWDSLAKPGTQWADDPWVWVYCYEPCGMPEGFLDA